MKLIKLFVLLFFILLSTLCSGSSQQTNSDSLNFIEKVYLHTDRTNYYSGDDIWFKAYLIEATGKLLTDNSMNLHVELISPDQKIIDSHILKLDNGLGNGDFHLAKKIESGCYRLRAYTNYYNVPQI